MALLAARQKENQRFVGAKQLLHVFNRERLRARQFRIVGKLFFKSRGDRRDLSFDIRQLLAQSLSRLAILLSLGLRKDLDELPVPVAPQADKILTLTHESSQRAAAGGEPHAQLLQRCRG